LFDVLLVSNLELFEMEALLLACCLASLRAVLLDSDAPPTSVSLDGLAMVGTTHTHNVFDVLCMSHDPLV
jgi:hypothetical protein